MKSLKKEDLQLKNLSLLKENEKECKLCPRLCKVDRRIKKGFCKSSLKPGVASYNLHRGEEPFISGTNGSGTVFFHHCTMSCIFCQNFPISQIHDFPEVSEENLAKIFLELQKKGAHNINLVTPTHFTVAIASAIFIAIKEGLQIPVVWNSNGYENVNIIRLLEPFVDIWLPDLKYFDNNLALKFSNVSDYKEYATYAIAEMFRQKGNLKLNEKGIAISGLVIRHLVLPDCIENSKEVLRFIANSISRDASVSIMSQYFPAWKAVDIKSLNRTLTSKEYDTVIDFALSLGLKNALIQDLSGEGGC